MGVELTVPVGSTTGVGTVVDVGTEVGVGIDVPLLPPQAADASAITDTRKIKRATVRIAGAWKRTGVEPFFTPIDATPDIWTRCLEHSTRPRLLSW